jgi:hypothetical protein
MPTCIQPFLPSGTTNGPPLSPKQTPVPLVMGSAHSMLDVTANNPDHFWTQSESDEMENSSS